MDDGFLRDAHKEFNGHSWEAAFEAFRAADADGGLSPEDLDLLSEAAYWAAHVRRYLAFYASALASCR